MGTSTPRDRTFITIWLIFLEKTSDLRDNAIVDVSLDNKIAIKF